MTNREKILRRAQMLASGLMPRDYRGHMLKEGYSHGLHDYMQHNEQAQRAFCRESLIIPIRGFN